MPAAVVVPALITAGASAGAAVYAAHKQSSAAEKAAKTQADAATRAAELEAKATEDSRKFLEERIAEGDAAMQPYIDIGQSGLRGLSQFMGYDVGALPTPKAGGATLAAFAPSAPPVPAPKDPAIVPAVSGSSLASFASSRAGLAPSKPASGASTERSVWMRAPDQSVKQVPQSQVDFYRSRGAEVVA